MNIAQIKRFVNDSLIPLNRLIGSPEDDTSKNTLFGIQKKMLMSGGGGVKHVYRGIASGAGIVTLPAAVNMDKTVVLSTSKGSSGYVAARGSISFPNFTLYGNPENTTSQVAWYSSYVGLFPQNGNTSTKKFFMKPDSTGSISGGTTDLTVREYSARLIDENTIYCDGPVEWQVIEYN